MHTLSIVLQLILLVVCSWCAGILVVYIIMLRSYHPYAIPKEDVWAYRRTPSCMCSTEDHASILRAYVSRYCVLCSLAISIMY